MNTIDSTAAATADVGKSNLKTGVLELAVEDKLGLELLSTKKRLAEAELKLAMAALRDAQHKATALTRDQAIFLTRLAHKHELPQIKAIRFVDGTKIAYELQ